MSVRLNKVLTELNIGLQTAIDYLKNKKSLGDIKDDANVNTKITDEQYDALVKEFKGDKDVKYKVETLFDKKLKHESEKLEIYKEFTMLSRLHDIPHAGQPVIEEQPVVEERTMIEFEPERKQYETKLDVLERVRELAHGDEVPQKEEVDYLKTCFYKLHIAECEAQLKAYIDGGGDPEQYQIVTDQTYEAFKAEMVVVREKRQQLFRQQEQKKQDNLEKKMAIIDKIKSMMKSPEEANNNLNEFIILQHQWCKIKNVPAEKKIELWKDYMVYCENIYDLLHIYCNKNGDEKKVAFIEQLKQAFREQAKNDGCPYDLEDYDNYQYVRYEPEEDDQCEEDDYELEKDENIITDVNFPNEDEDNSDNNLGYIDTLDMNNRQENIDNVKASIKLENINSIIMDKMDNERMKDIVTSIYQSQTAEECYQKGENYYYGKNGVSKDYAEALNWAKKAAEQGHKGAQFRVGTIYDFGSGVSKDYAEAAKWYRKAAEQGYSVAQSNLGNMYKNGWGVAKDYNEAVKWYRKAAEQGNSTAQNGLGVAYYSGEGVTKDYKLAMEWYQKAAAQGDKYAMRNIGILYECGYGETQDYQKAKEWYQKAVNKDPNYSSAKTSLANIEKKISAQGSTGNDYAQNNNTPKFTTPKTTPPTTTVVKKEVPILDFVTGSGMKDIVTNIYQSLQVFPGQFRDYSEFQNRIMSLFQILGYNTIKPEELKETIVELFPSVKFLEKFHRDADGDNPQYDLELAFRINSLDNVARVDITKSEPQNTQQPSVCNKSVPSSETLSQIIKLLDTIPMNPNNKGYVDLALTGSVFKSNGIDIKLYAKSTADFFQKYLSDTYDLKKGSPEAKEPPYSFRKKKEPYKPIHQTISRIDSDSNKKEIKETEKACLTKDLLKRVYNSIDEEGEWGYKNFNVFRQLISEKLGIDFSEAELKDYLKKECKGVKYYKNHKSNNGIINAFRADSLKWKAIDELMAFAIFPLIKKNGKNAFQQAIDQLADKALSEKWYYGTGEKSSNPILFNYFLLTFQRLKAEDREHRDDINWKTKIRESSNGDKALFNTGLVDSLYDPIYALFNRNQNRKNERKWMFSKFIGGRDKEMQTLTRDFGTDLPLPAHYYNDTSELVYNIKSKIGSYNWDHFIDHCERLPLDFLEGIVRSFEGDFDFSQKRNSTFYRNLAEYIKGNDEILRGIKNRIENAIKDAIKRVHWNFKTAIPIYYPGQKQISLLLPLSLKRKDRIDVALVLEAVENGAYIAHTILTLQMAYTNARLITRPDSDWLTAESIDDNDNMIEDIED